MIPEIALSIWENPSFNRDYVSLLKLSLEKSMGTGSNDEFKLESVPKLLQSAAVLAVSSDHLHKEAAFRIAISAWHMFRSEFSNIDNYLMFILGRLGNFPSMQLLHKYLHSRVSHENLDALEQQMPLSLWYEIEARKLSNSIVLPNEDVLQLTDFQKELWDDLTAGTSIAVSAPTSAGKSFVLQSYLATKLAQTERFVAVYVVPTRALINQVSASLQESLARLAQSSVRVVPIPIPVSELETDKVIYVLTQERLQVLLEYAESIQFDLAIVDEAQLIASDSRGVILQTVVERILKHSPGVQVAFAAPLTANPELLPVIFDLDGVKSVCEDETPVAQNIVKLDIDPRTPSIVEIRARIQGEDILLGQRNVDTALVEEQSTLASLSWFFGKGYQNLVYAGGKAACEDIADLVVQMKQSERDNQQEDREQDADLVDFIKFVKEHVHQRYLLAHTLAHGVAFHYGHMPALIRKTVEEFFAEGKIDYLVCTSTLLHGVNLPAKNLFLLKPTKGDNIAISSHDFWNLAGRAGRLGKDFQGNVFAINLKDWDKDPTQGERKEPIESSFHQTIVQRGAELIAFAANAEHPSGQQQDLESTFVKLYNDFKGGYLQKTLAKLGDRITPAFQTELLDALKTVEQRVQVPQDILEKNITISPYRQNELLDYMVKRIAEKDPRELIPMHPAVATYQAYIRLFRRLHKYFEMTGTEDTSHKYFAMLAIRWMRGDSLAKLINDAYDYRKKVAKRGIPDISTTIRSVMEHIEQHLRFRYVKYTRCYNDLLRFALLETENEELIGSIPPIPLFLELGACSETMVNLIGLGLTRTTAGILNGRAASKSMSRHETWDWINRCNFVEMEVPKVCLREISRILEQK